MSSSVLAVTASTWGVMMALAPVLQIRTIVKRRSSADVSLGYLVVLLIGFVLWLFYGISITNYALIIPNSVAITTAIATIVVILRHRPAAEQYPSSD